MKLEDRNLIHKAVFIKRFIQKQIEIKTGKQKRIT